MTNKTNDDWNLVLILKILKYFCKYLFRWFLFFFLVYLEIKSIYVWFWSWNFAIDDIKVIAPKQVLAIPDERFPLEMLIINVQNPNNILKHW